MKQGLLLIVLMLLLSVQPVKADVVSYGPVTIASDTCDEPIYFDILIDETKHTLNSEIQTDNFTHVSDISTLFYLNQTGYVSYAAYYPEANVDMGLCYTRFALIEDHNITSYKLIAYDESGNTLSISSVRNLTEITNPVDTEGDTVYYLYDVDTGSFVLDTHTYPQDSFYVGPNFYLIIFGIILVVSPGVLWVLRKTKLL